MAFTRYFFTIIHRGGGCSSYLLQKANILQIEVKYLSTIEQTLPNHRMERKKALAEAEKIVDYTNPFFRVFSEENLINNLSLLKNKFIGSKHPILSIAKDLVFNDQYIMQNWDLIVLLLSRTAGFAGPMDEDQADEVLKKQTEVSKTTELIRTGYLLHRGLVTIKPDEYMEQSLKDDMIFGNKISLLIGDILLSTGLIEMAKTKNQKILELMSLTLGYLNQSEFIGRRDKQNMPLPSTSDNPDVVQEWEKRNFGPESLLGNACLLVLMLAGYSEELQQQGYKFGKHYALAWQSYMDLLPFLESKYQQGTTFNLTSAPVLFHLRQDPSLFTEIEKGVESVDNVDFKKVHEKVSTGNGIGLTEKLHNEHSQRALEVLQHFEESEAKTALVNLILTMEYIGRF